jgi:hypothetical protein
VKIKILVQNIKRFQKIFDIRKITNYLVEKHDHIYVQSTVRVCNEKRHIELNYVILLQFILNTQNLEKQKYLYTQHSTCTLYSL